MSLDSKVGRAHMRALRGPLATWSFVATLWCSGGCSSNDAGKNPPAEDSSSDKATTTKSTSSATDISTVHTSSHSETSSSEQAGGSGTAETSTPDVEASTAPDESSSQVNITSSNDESTEQTTTSDESGGDTATSDTGTSSTVDTCVLSPPVPQAATGHLTLGFRLALGETPFTLQEQTEIDGDSYNFSLFATILVTPTLETANGERVDAAFVDANGMPLPYGLYYVDAANPPAQMYLQAPPGDYVALRFELGTPTECDGGSVIGREPPLEVGGTLHWTWGGNSYMVVRIEGSGATSDAALETFNFHLGRLLDTPLVKSSINVDGDFAVTTTVAGPHQTLTLDVAHVMAPRPAEVMLGHNLQADWLITNLVDTGFRVEGADAP